MFALWGQRMCLETVNRIFHADIALIKLFQGLAVIFFRYGSSSRWVACAGTPSRSSLHTNQRLLAPDQRELDKSFPKTCSSNLRAPCEDDDDDGFGHRWLVGGGG